MLAIVIPSSNGIGACDDEDLDTIIRRWSRPIFRVFALCHLLSAGAILLMVQRIERQMIRAAAELYPPSEHDEEGGSGATEGGAERRGGETAEASTDPPSPPPPEAPPKAPPKAPHPGPELLPPRERTLLRLGYPLLIGLVASWTVLLVKSVGTLVRSTFADGLGVWGRYESWLMLLGLCMSVPTQLTYLNRALARFESLFVVPSLQCFWSLSSITMGAIFFQEFDLYKPWSAPRL